MSKVEGKLDRTDFAWHRDAAIVLRMPLVVDPTVARVRIERTLALLTADGGRAAPIVESEIEASSNHESGILRLPTRESGPEPSSTRRRK